MANDAALTLPATTLAAEGGPAINGTGAITLPAFTAEGYTVGVALPAFALEATASQRSSANADIELPLTVTATGMSGAVGSASITLPALTLEASTPIALVADLPAFTLDAAGSSGEVGRASVSMSALTLDATASSPVVATASLALPLPVVEGAASSGNVGTANNTLAALSLAASGVSGTIATADLTLPVFALDASGAVESIGTATVTLPALTLTATASQAKSASYSAYALNTERRALTTYSGLQIRGLTQFNGVYLACGPGGLFALSGDTDDGALINATVRLANTDFGDPKLKRVEAMYVNYRTDGDLSLKVITDQFDEYDYPLPGMGFTTLDNQRVKVGKGLKGVYWTFELTNVDGADFEFDRLQVDPLATSRKIG